MGKRTKSAGRTARAKLQLSVPRVATLIRDHQANRRVSDRAQVFLAGAAQRILEQLLTTSRTFCKKTATRPRIRPRHLFLAIHSDKGLHALLQHTTIAQSGVLSERMGKILENKRA